MCVIAASLSNNFLHCLFRIFIPLQNIRSFTCFCSGAVVLCISCDLHVPVQVGLDFQAIFTHRLLPAVLNSTHHERQCQRHSRDHTMGVWWYLGRSTGTCERSWPQSRKKELGSRMKCDTSRKNTALCSKHAVYLIVQKWFPVSNKSSRGSTKNRHSVNDSKQTGRLRRWERFKIFLLRWPVTGSGQRKTFSSLGVDMKFWSFTTSYWLGKQNLWKKWHQKVHIVPQSKKRKKKTKQMVCGTQNAKLSGEVDPHFALNWMRLVVGDAETL